MTATPADHSFYYDPAEDVGECPVCGGEGFLWECFDGRCADADVGCDDCTTICDCQKTSTLPSQQSNTPGA